MEIKAKDTYRIQLSGSLGQERVFSLMELYQPLIGQPAVIAYLTMAAECSNHRTQDSFGRLLQLCGMDPQSFDRAVSKLEEYMLVRVYEKSSETKSSFVFVLHLPMNAADFGSAGIYVSRYIRAVGQNNYEATCDRLLAGNVSLQGYKDITRQIVHVNVPEEQAPVQYTHLKPKYNFADDDSIVFDYDAFIRKASDIVFPLASRTNENLELIGRLATVYGLTVQQMVRLVGSCSNLSEGTIDTERLRTLAAKARSEADPSADPYEMAPKSFLQSRMNGRPVTMVDAKTLEYLSVTMRFPSPVINVMVEYILNISGNRLPRNLVESIAGTWAREGIATKEDALKAAKKGIAEKNGRSAMVTIEAPQFIKDAARGIEVEEEKASQETIERFNRRMNRAKD